MTIHLNVLQAKFSALALAIVVSLTQLGAAQLSAPSISNEDARASEIREQLIGSWRPEWYLEYKRTDHAAEREHKIRREVYDTALVLFANGDAYFRKENQHDPVLLSWSIEFDRESVARVKLSGKYVSTKTFFLDGDVLVQDWGDWSKADRLLKTWKRVQHSDSQVSYAETRQPVQQAVLPPTSHDPVPLADTRPSGPTVSASEGNAKFWSTLGIALGCLVFLRLLLWSSPRRK